MLVDERQRKMRNPPSVRVPMEGDEVETDRPPGVEHGSTNDDKRTGAAGTRLMHTLTVESDLHAPYCVTVADSIFLMSSIP